MVDFLLIFQGCQANAGGGMDPDTGIFTCPLGGVYMFVFHVATHDNKKALLSIRLNGEEVASVFDQNHKVIVFILSITQPGYNYFFIRLLKSNIFYFTARYLYQDNHKNSMAGTNILIPLKRGDEVVVYAYTGTWLADFAMNHYTHWVGLLLKVSKFCTLNL